MPDLPAGAEAFDEAVTRLGLAATSSAVTLVRALFEQLARAFAAAYVVASDRLTDPPRPQAVDGLRRALQAALGTYTAQFAQQLPAVAAGLAGTIRRGLVLGARSVTRDPIPGLAPSPRLANLPESLTNLPDVLGQVGPGGIGSYQDVLVLLGRARQASLGQVERIAGQAVDQAAAEGVRQAADHLGVSRLWIASRNACLACLAYSGRIAGPGEDFPGGLTYADKSYHPDPVPDPPLHPNCRCRVVMWLGTDTSLGPVGIQFPAALSREAQRSVLMGTSDYASRPAKFRALERVLSSGMPGLPESVRTRARFDLSRGLFTTEERRGFRPRSFVVPLRRRTPRSRS